MARLFLILGSLGALLAVVLGAFGAHGLKDRLAPDALALYQTAVEYHFYHALGLLLIGIAAFHLADSLWLRCAGWLLFAGTVIFSGSLYLLAIGGQRWLGVLTPFGGLAFIAGWAALAVAVVRSGG